MITISLVPVVLLLAIGILSTVSGKNWPAKLAALVACWYFIQNPMPLVVELPQTQETQEIEVPDDIMPGHPWYS